MSTLPVGKLFLRSVIVSATAFSLWKLLRLALYDPYRSPLRRLRGPKGTSLILGNLNEVTKDFTVRRCHPICVQSGLSMPDSLSRRMVC